MRINRASRHTFGGGARRGRGFRLLGVNRAGVEPLRRRFIPELHAGHNVLRELVLFQCLTCRASRRFHLGRIHRHDQAPYSYRLSNLVV